MAKYLTTAQAAAVLGVIERRVRALCAAGRLGQKIGRQYLIEAEELARFKKVARKVGHPPKDTDKKSIKKADRVKQE